jgi:uncharacterized protein
MIELLVESVRINLATQQRVVILKAKPDERYLFLWIANAEAYAIALWLQGTASPRPLTHDLLKDVIEGMGATIVQIEITDLIGDIFYARMILDLAGKQIEIDARPSDAFALAIRAHAPIFVEESVLERAGVSLDAREEASAPETGPEKEPEQKNVVEAEQTPPETTQDEVTQLRKENKALKEQLARMQNDLEAAQRRIAELENK